MTVNTSLKPRLVLAGGSGLLGNLLAGYFAEQGWEISVLTRSPRKRTGAVRDIGWDGETPGEWASQLEGAQALVNLCGTSVNCRYTVRNRRLILNSRVSSTRVLGRALASSLNPPELWVNSSTATIYRHTFGPAWDESGEISGTREAKDEFSVEVATAWERVFNEAVTPRTRKILLRSAMVLSPGRNSVFPVLRRLTRLGLGGMMGSGRQYVSWIHQQDYCRAVQWLIDRPDLAGVFNLAAPNPVTNAEMMRAIRRIYRRSFGLPASRWMLEVGAFLLRTETELVIKSRRVVPGALRASGFEFRFPDINGAFADLKN